MRGKLKNLLRIIYYLNFKTLYFNFKYLDFKNAVKFPFFISKYVYLKNTSGQIKIQNIRVDTGMIRIGFGDVGIFDNKRSRTIWEVKGEVIFKGETDIGHGSKLVVGKDGKLTMGERFTINAESSIICFYEVVFGNDCLLSWDILIMDTDFHKMYLEPINNRIPLGEQINKDRKITIGDNCWIGCRSLILKGTKIPKNTIIAANSMITNLKNLEVNPYSILGGNPLRVLKTNVIWKK